MDNYKQSLLQGGGSPVTPKPEEPDTIDKLKKYLRQMLQQPEGGDGFNFNKQAKQ